MTSGEIIDKLIYIKDSLNLGRNSVDTINDACNLIQRLDITKLLKPLLNCRFAIERIADINFNVKLAGIERHEIEVPKPLEEVCSYNKQVGEIIDGLVLSLLEINPQTPNKKSKALELLESVKEETIDTTIKELLKLAEVCGDIVDFEE